MIYDTNYCSLDWDVPFDTWSQDKLRAMQTFNKYNLHTKIRPSARGNTHVMIFAEMDKLNNIMLRAYLNDDNSRLRADCSRLYFGSGFNRLFDYKHVDGKEYYAGEWKDWTKGHTKEFNLVKHNPTVKEFTIEWNLSFKTFRESISYNNLMEYDKDIEMEFEFNKTEHNTTQVKIYVETDLLQSYIYSALFRDERNHLIWKIWKDYEQLIKTETKGLYTPKG